MWVYPVKSWFLRAEKTEIYLSIERERETEKIDIIAKSETKLTWKWLNKRTCAVLYTPINSSPGVAIYLKLQQVQWHKDFKISAKSEAMAYQKTLTQRWHSLSNIEMHTTSIVNCAAICSLIFFFSCCFPVQQIHRATGAGCHLPEKLHIKQVVWQDFLWDHTTGGGGWIQAYIHSLCFSLSSFCNRKYSSLPLPVVPVAQVYSNT